MPRINVTSNETPMEPVPEAEYLYAVDSHEMVTNSKGNRMLKVVFSNQSEDTFTLEDGTQAPLKNRQVHHNFNLLPNSIWALCVFFDAAGVPYTKTPTAVAREYDVDFDTDDISDKFVLGYTKQHTYVDKQGNNKIGNSIEKFGKPS